MILILKNERRIYPGPSLWMRVPNGPVVFSWVDLVAFPVRMAVNWGGGRGLCANTIAAEKARMASARIEKNEEEGMLVSGRKAEVDV